MGEQEWPFPEEPPVPYARGWGIVPMPAGQTPMYDHLRLSAVDAEMPPEEIELPLPDGVSASKWMLGGEESLTGRFDPEAMIDYEQTIRARFEHFRSALI